MREVRVAGMAAPWRPQLLLLHGANLILTLGVAGFVFSGIEITERHALQHAIEGSLILGLGLMHLASAYLWLRLRAQEEATHRRQLEHYATSDHLTQLHNRRAFFQHLRNTLEWARQHQQPVAVLLLDADGFKDINDDHGHSVGDQALAKMAERLREACRPHDLPARVGGDEFAIIMPGLTEEEARRAGERIVEAIGVPTFLAPWAPQPAAEEGQGVWLQLRASVGVAGYPWSGTDMDAILAAADRHLYAQKAARAASQAARIMRLRPAPSTGGE